MSAGGGRIWLLYAVGCKNDAPCTLQSVADRPIVDGRTHTMPVSAAVNNRAVRSTPEGTCGLLQRCHCRLCGVTVSSMVTVGRRRCRCMAEPGCRRKAQSSQPSRQFKLASSLAHVRARVGERCAKTAIFFNHMQRECNID